VTGAGIGLRVARVWITLGLHHRRAARDMTDDTTRRIEIP